MSQRFANDDGSLLALGALTLFAGAGVVARRRGSRGVSYTEQIRALARSGGKPDAKLVRDHAKRHGWTQAQARDGIEVDVQVYLSKPAFYDGLVAQGSAAFDLDAAIGRATAADYYPRSERSDVHGNPLLRAISWSAGGAAIYGDSTFESAVKHIGAALRKSEDRLRSQTGMRIFKRDGRWYTASSYYRDERHSSRTKAIEAFVRNVGPRQAQTDALYHGVDTRPKGSRSGITLHEWVRDGRLVRLLRTDAPGFHTEYAAAKRRYGLPTHSMVIGR